MELPAKRGRADGASLLLLDDRGRPRSGLRVLLFGLLLVAAGWLVGLALRLARLRPGPLAEGGVLDPGALALRGASLLAVALLASWAAARLVDRRRSGTLGFRLRAPVGRQLLLGAAAGAFGPLAYALVLASAGHLEVRPGAAGGGVLLLALAGFLTAATAEELLLRGYALQNLSVPLGPWPAVLLTGLLFGWMHAGNPGAGAEGMIVIAVAGILLGLLAVRTASLWAVCAYHAAWNVTGGLVLGLPVSGLPAPPSLLRSEVSGPSWLAGGAFGYESSWITLAAEVVALGAALWLAGPRCRHEENGPWFRRRWRGEPPLLWGEAPARRPEPPETPVGEAGAEDPGRQT